MTLTNFTTTSSSQHHRSSSNPSSPSPSIRQVQKEQDRKSLISKWQNGLMQSTTSTLTEIGHSSSISSTSFQSTLNTSINSIQPNLSTYQPKPLLLSTLNLSKQPINSNLKRPIPNLDNRQSKRSQDEILNESNLKKKQERANELKQISLNLNPSFENPNDDQWDGLSSSSDLNENWSSKEEEQDDDDSIQVVWRASLDIGRKVSKNRKALGKSSGLKPFSNHPSNQSKLLNHHSFNLIKPQSVLLDWISLLKSFWWNSSLKNPSRLFLFGSGIFAGIFSSIFSSSILRSTWIERSHLGFFINFLFPSDLSLPHNLIGWSTPNLIRLTGIGFYYHC